MKTMYTHFALFQDGMTLPSLLLNLCLQCCHLLLCSLNIFCNCPNFTSSLLNTNYMVSVSFLCGSFHDEISVSRLQIVNEWITGEWQTGKGLEGSTYNQSEETILAFTGREQEKPQKLSVRINAVPVKIQNVQASLQCYHNLLSVTVIKECWTTCTEGN